jgi:hypothetical protein
MVRFKGEKIYQKTTYIREHRPYLKWNQLFVSYSFFLPSWFGKNKTEIIVSMVSVFPVSDRLEGDGTLSVVGLLVVTHSVGTDSKSS